MKTGEIYYERTINLGNFESEKIGIKLILEEGEKSDEALLQAKRFIDENRSIKK